MPKATRTLSGASQEKYFRELLAAEPGLTRDGAERLKAVYRNEISQLRVRTPIPKRSSRQTAKPEDAAAQGRDEQRQAAERPDLSAEPGPRVAPATEPPVPAEAAPRPAAPAAEPVAAPDVESACADDPPALAPFDPYAFSLVALLKTGGREALLSRLDEIGSSENLYKLAQAQHIAVPPGIDGPTDIRDAIANGAEQRLADRRAAAS